MIPIIKNSRIAARNSLIHLFRLSILTIAAVIHAPGAFAATPGLPFTEDFTDPGLRDAELTNARWSVSSNALILDDRAATGLGLSPDTLTAFDITLDTDYTYDIHMRDLNGDGYKDVIATGSTTAIYLHNGTSSPFEGVTGIPLIGGMGIATGDVDRDGDIDIAIARQGSPALLCLNDGTAYGFSSYQSCISIGIDADTTYAIELADMNSDGLLDVIVANKNQENKLYLNENSIDLFNNVITGTPVTADVDDSRSMAIADFNNDGHLDLLIGNYSGSGSGSKVYINNGSATPFSGVVAISLHVNGTYTNDVAVGDVNNDGYVDVVTGDGVSGGQPNKLYMNYDGVFGVDAGPYELDPTHISITNGVALVDVDHDGDLDFIAASISARDKIILNNGTVDPFGVLDLVSPVPVPAIDFTHDSLADSSMDVGDIDNDGDIDVIIGASSSVNRLYINNSTTRPFAKSINSDITQDADTNYSVATGDIDNDGDIDLVTGHIWGRVNLYFNDGDSEPFDFTSGVLRNTGYGMFGIALHDVNHDSYLDLLIPDLTNGVRIVINDPANPVLDSSITAYTAGNSGVYHNALAFGDINRDGLDDIVMAKAGVNEYILNDGTDAPFDATAPTGFDLSDTSTSTDIDIGDVNNDGNLDIVVANNGQNKLYLHDKTGSPYGSSTSITSDSNTTNTIVLADMNRDGLLDVVVGNDYASNKIYLNDGVGDPFDTATGIQIGTSGENSSQIAVKDINHDGFLDIITTHESAKPVMIYLTEGNENYNEIIGVRPSSESFAGYGVSVEDFNGDGDQDIVVVGRGINRLYHNDAEPEAFNTISDILIDTSSYATVPVNVGDFNNDGKLDVVAGVWGSVNRLNINNGTRDPFNQAAQSIGTDVMNTQALAVGDVNKDGLPDIVSGNNGNNNLLHLNNGTSTPFTGAGTNVSNVAETDITRDLIFADLNKDGYLDVVAGNQGIHDKIYFHTGNPAAPYAVAPASVWAIDFNTRVIRAGDIDNDGDIDLITGNDNTVSGSNTGGNAVFINDGTGAFTNGYFVEFGFDSVNYDKDNTYGLALGDINNDGLLDLVVGNYAGVNKYYLNDGSATPFRNTSGNDIGIEIDNTRAVALEDLDQDGDLDLVVVNVSGTDKYYLNNGTATPFDTNSVAVSLPNTANPINPTGYGVAIGDIDSDGNNDLIVGDFGGQDHFYTSLPYDVAKNRVYSKTVNAEGDILKATLTGVFKETPPANTSVKWYLSNDGGARYYQVESGVEFTFPEQGNDLRWHAEINSLSPKYSPRIDEVTISARFDHDLDYVTDDIDLCVGIYDPDQLDNDGDAVPGVSTGPMTGGDACDIDDDNDGIGDVGDLFPFNYDESADTDGDCGAIDYNLTTSGNGCGDASDPDIDGDGLANGSDPFMFNVSPTISGSPATTATPKTLYSFSPVVSDGGDGPSLSASLTFSGGTHADLPSWLSFNTSTGALSGVPSNDDYGVIDTIVISVSDSVQTAALTSFSINVVDTRAPTTFAVPGSGNFNEDAVVNIACFENIGSGCSTIHYTTDDAALPGAFTTVFAQSTVITIPSSAGNANLRFYSVDADGNTENIKSETYNFDLDYPVISINTPADGSIVPGQGNTLDIIEGGHSDIGTGIVGISIQITDGVNSVQSFGGSLTAGSPAWIDVVDIVAGAWSYDTTGLNWTSDTTYTITARAVDGAGNTTTTSQSFTFYNTAPSTTDLDLSLTSTSISTGQTTDAFLTFTRLNNLSADLTDVPLELHITKPDASVVIVNGTVNNTGNLTLQQLGDGAAITFDTAGVYSMVAKFTDTATYPNLAAATSNPVSLLVGTSAGYAIIIQGKLSNEEGLQSHNKTANRIYETFKDRGFADEDIFYFNYDTNQTGVDALPDKATIQKLIEGSANGVADPQVLQDQIPLGLAAEIADLPAPVYIVMVDHGGKAVDGQEARFFLGDEVILPSELNQWMGTLEANLDAIDTAAGTPAPDWLTLNNNRIVIIGACYSGGFISGVSGDGRIVITSATENEPSYKGPIEDDNIRVGEYFLEELFLELGAGNNLRDAFKIATAKTESYTKEASGDTSTNSNNEFLDVAVQHPLLDDDANGAGTNAIFDTTTDGQSALDVVLGFDQGSLTNDAFIPADVDSVSGAQYLDKNTSSAILTMHANDPSQVNQAYVEIRTPQKILAGAVESATEQLSSDFIRRAYLPPVAEGEPYTLDYTDFVEPGKYEIFSYVNDRFTGALSSARRSLIYKNRPDTAPTADDVDGINDAPTSFNQLTPINGDSGPYITGFTWEASSDPDNDAVTYSFYLADDSGFTSFSKDNGNGSCTQQSEPYVEEEITGTATFVDAATGLCDGRTYYWKVEAVDPYGLHATSSTFSYQVSNHLNADIGVIVAMVKSATTNQQLTAANISNSFGETATATASVLYNGNYVLFTSNTGVGQTITVAKTNYSNQDIVLTNGVASGETIEVLFDMPADALLDSDGDGVIDTSDNCPAVANGAAEDNQLDTDSDGEGNACDDDDDGDQIPDAYEDLYAFLDPLNASDAALDQDGDTLSNLTEYRDGTNPGVFNVIPSDVDGDGIDDSVDNCLNTYNPDQLNTDGDAQGNACDTDDDGDGMSDVFEMLYGLDPLLNDAADDLDSDGFTNLQEFTSDTDPTAAPGTTTDIDGDGVFDAYDNCPAVTNASQLDSDTDGDGDACDTDDDNDGVADVIDAFDLDAAETLDTDGDGIGNNADADDDGDGVDDIDDAFPLNAAEWLDTDGDGVGNNADGDDDNDGVNDAGDAFPLDSTESVDTDLDGIGNNADLDDDGDGIVDTADAFPLDAGETLDTDKDGIGNNADTDDDGDGVLDVSDTFPLDATESVDTDADGIGNNADSDDDGDDMPDAFEILYGLNPLVNDASGDVDGDGVSNLNEYLGGTNPNVINSDTTDSDGDGVTDVTDNCPATINASQLDTDADGAGDACDSDDDNDGVNDASDAFPLDATESVDTDLDGIGNNADLDDDGDTVADTLDAFPLDAGESVDTDRDGVGDNADSDDDGDGVADTLDAFPLDAFETLDTDLDGIGNNADGDDDNDGMSDAFEILYGLDPLSDDANGDADGDGVINIDEFNNGTNPIVINSDTIDNDSDGVKDFADNCPAVANAAQTDTDGDTIGDACDPDDDNDGVLDASDLFPLMASESADFDGDGTGNNADTDDDDDGMSDAFETLYSLNPMNAADADIDTDGDGLTNLQEFLLGTNPNVINSDTIDSDGDGVKNVTDNCPADINASQLDTDSDGVGDACDNDKDNDGVVNSSDAFPLDASESADADGDGTGNNADADDDNDGMSDAFEILYGLDPFDPSDANGDLDNDGKSNLQEYQAGTSPKSLDTVADGSTTATSSKSSGMLHPLFLLALLINLGLLSRNRRGLKLRSKSHN